MRERASERNALDARPQAFAARYYADRMRDGRRGTRRHGRLLAQHARSRTRSTGHAVADAHAVTDADAVADADRKYLHLDGVREHRADERPHIRRGGRLRSGFAAAHSGFESHTHAVTETESHADADAGAFFDHYRHL